MDTDVTAITNLNASNKGITNLEGIQHLKSLKSALLSNNKISNISCLSTLTTLTILDIANNKVENLDAIRNLNNLVYIALDNNHPVSFEPVTSLTKLKMLSLSNTGIQGPGIIDRLASSSTLISLSLEGNDISEIGPLTSCANLSTLNLGKNKISDLSLISKFTKLRSLNLNDNLISDISPIKSVLGISNINLENNQISSILPLKGLGSLYQLDIGGNSINLNELSGFSSITSLSMNNSNISDISALTKLNLVDLQLDNNQIRELTPLCGKTSLRYLSLNGNQISNINPLSGLSSLSLLNLCDNQITDISPLASLSLLESLYITNNRVIDIGVLSSLPSVQNLGIGGNPISNIQQITQCSNITQLELDNLGLSDISFLSNMPQLSCLVLNGNSVSDFSIIRNLENLEMLGISNTGIKDLAVLSNLSKLIALDIKDNGISDIKPLENLNNLIYLYLQGNKITDYRPIEDVYDRLMFKDFEFEILPVLGCLEVPTEGYAVSGTINLSGYYLDPENVSKIEVLVDGIKMGDAVYGDLREDIAQSYPKYYNSNAGFHYQLNTGNLTTGSHVITIRETSRLGTVNTLPARNIVVSRLIPRGVIDRPYSGETVTGNYKMWGWFLDPSKVSKIEVLVDGIVVGNTIYGDLRQDVYNAYPAYNNSYSGYHYTLDTLVLSEGAHKISIIETGLNGVKTTLNARTIYVARLMPKGYLDKPASGQNITGVSKVSGWFLDNSGVDKIEILVDGVVKGTATYGLSRPDVAKVYPQYNNSNSGFEYSLDTSTLATGKHTIVIREKGKNGAETSLSGRVFYVSR